MIDILSYKGLEVPESANLGAVVVKPIDRAIGTAGEWTSVIDPDAVTGGALKDIGADAWFDSTSFTTSTISGFPALVPSAGADLVADAAIKPDEFSVVFCGKVSTTSGGKDILNRVDSADTGSLGLRVGINTSVSSVYVLNSVDGNERLRVNLGGAFSSNAAGWIMVTFSVERGLRIYINGALAGTAVGENDPLDGWYEPNTWQWFAGSEAGSMFFAGVINDDMSRPENALGRTQIDAWCHRFMGA